MRGAANVDLVAVASAQSEPAEPPFGGLEQHESASRFLLVPAFPKSGRRPSKEALLTQHPMLYVVDIRCSSCAASFTIRSTVGAISTDVCSNCHPAYTGRERAVATGSRIAGFDRRRALAAA